MFLSVAVSDKACLELVDRTVGFALDCKYKVAVHNVGGGRNGSDRYEVPGVERNETRKFLVDSFAPLLGLRTRHGLPVAFRHS